VICRPGEVAGPEPASEGVQIQARVRWLCNGYTATRIAALTGCNQETARRYIKGLNNPSPAFLAALCRALGVSPAWLLLGRGSPYEGGPPQLEAVPFEGQREALRALAHELQRRVELV
jgi:transcriptional regulator with XRE-family HTH domain